VLIAKLTQLNDAIERVDAKRPASIEQLLADRDLQDIITKNLERAVQVSIDIATHLATMNGFVPTTSAQSFRMLADAGELDRDLAAAMSKAVGFRNVSVHDYVAIDWRIVMHVANAGLDDIKAFGRRAKDLVSAAAPPPPGRR